MAWATGESFEGQWVKDKFHGAGKLTTLLCTYTGGNPALPSRRFDVVSSVCLCVCPVSCVSCVS